MSTIVALIIVLIVLGLIWYLIGMLPLKEPFKMIVSVLFIIACILLLLGMLTGGVNFHWLRL